MSQIKLFLRNVAMIIACLAVTVVISNCSSGNSSNKGNSSGNSKVRVIKASELISISEAAAILEQSINSSEDDKMYFSDEIRYRSAIYTFSVRLAQEALHDNSSDFEKKLLKNGWKSYLKDMEKNLSSGTTKIDVSGGTGYLQETNEIWMFYIFYEEYYITLSLVQFPLSHIDTDEEKLWKTQRLTEAGKIAVNNLKNILSKN